MSGMLIRTNKMQVHVACFLQTLMVFLMLSATTMDDRGNLTWFESVSPHDASPYFQTFNVNSSTVEFLELNWNLWWSRPVYDLEEVECTTMKIYKTHFHQHPRHLWTGICIILKELLPPPGLQYAADGFWHALKAWITLLHPLASWMTRLLLFEAVVSSTTMIALVFVRLFWSWML